MLKSMHKSKNLYFYHVFVSPGSKENLMMLTNCLAAYAHQTITVSKIEQDIGRKSFFHTLLHSTRRPRWGGSRRNRHPVWHGKTRVAWLPDGEQILKISLFELAQLTNVTDTQTDTQTPHDGIGRAYA